MAQHSLYENANAAADFIRRTGAEIKAKGVSLDGVVPIDYPEKIREIASGGGSGSSGGDVDVEFGLSTVELRQVPPLALYVSDSIDLQMVEVKSI